MGEEGIAKIIKDNYELEVISVEKVKNTYKVYAKEGRYCVKVIKYQFPHFYFILSAILHLQHNGFKRIPEILNTKNGEYYINFFDKFAYLTEWIPSRESNYDNPIELERVSTKLGELHECSKGFTITNNMKPRIGWFSWVEVYKTRKNEILDFKNRINQKAYKSDFDNLYLSVLNEEIERADRAIKGLENSNYMKVMEREVFKRGFCHHDYANHNVLIDFNNNLNVIDFDYCILDTHIHDLASLLVRAMKNGKWGVEKATRIINAYSVSNAVTDEELSLIKEFIRFPQTFWQLGIQMYWEQQPWTNESFMVRLNKYLEDREEREEFINTFFS